MSNLRDLCFIAGSKHQTEKALTCFTVFRTRDEALVLVLDILLQAPSSLLNLDLF